MTNIFTALRGGSAKADPMQASAALTTVYLLEQNQKFEQFMRQKVEALEARVAAQQARHATPAEPETEDPWATWDAPADSAPVDERQAAQQLAEEAVTEMAWSTPDDESAGRMSPQVEAAEPSEPEADEAMPDYLALMTGSAEETLAPAETTAVRDIDTHLADPSDDEAVDSATMSLTFAAHEGTHFDDTLPEPGMAEPEVWAAEYEAFPTPAGNVESETTVDTVFELPGDLPPEQDDVSPNPTRQPDSEDETVQEEAVEPEDEDWEADLPDGQKQAWT